MGIPVEESGIPGMTVAAGGSGIPGTTVAAEESGIPEMTVAAGIQGMIPVWKGVLALSHRLAALAGVRKKSKPYGKKAGRPAVQGVLAFYGNHIDFLKDS